MMRPNDSRCVIVVAGLDLDSCPQCGATLGLSGGRAADRAGGRSPYSSTTGDSVATKRFLTMFSSLPRKAATALLALESGGTKPSRVVLVESLLDSYPVCPTAVREWERIGHGRTPSARASVDARDLAVNYEFKASLTSCVSDVSSWPRSVRSTPLVPSTAAIRSCEPL